PWLHLIDLRLGGTACCCPGTSRAHLQSSGAPATRSVGGMDNAKEISTDSGVSGFLQKSTRFCGIRPTFERTRVRFIASVMARTVRVTHLFTPENCHGHRQRSLPASAPALGGKRARSRDLGAHDVFSSRQASQG